ncbi:branched-chain amino acid aminotransferase, putative [Ricinus communis]|uniref:Branched-chain amino acid aminotransferase, putative n=1 Tax=Ricinus communis TaxID=3988 RepID=B9S7U4_RICCO|nr:branched-chain amino acid aminotransferase, putative [Ricinus communis]
MTATDFMFIMKCPVGQVFTGQSPSLCKHGDMSSCWSSKLWTGLIEGLKACRREGGRIMLFRPEENALSLQMGAERLCMAAPSVQQFVYAVKQIALVNRR